MTERINGLLEGLTRWVVIGFFLLQVAAAQGRHIYVNDDAPLGGNGESWGTAYKYLQDALDATDLDPTITEIRVARGTYTPDVAENGNHTPGDRTETFLLRDGVALRGGYADPIPGGPFGPLFAGLDKRNIALFKTILSGDLNGDDDSGGDNSENSYHVVTGSGTDETAILEGFTIESGNANGSGDHWTGAGILNINANPTVSQCTFRGNAGTCMYNKENAIVVSACTFTENSNTAVMNNNGTQTFSHCTFSFNSGTGVSSFENDGVFIDCAFIGNAVSGMVSQGGDHTYSYSALVNCIFAGNEAGGGGGFSSGQGSYAALTNCLFTGNYATGNGGALLHEGQTLTVANCTFSGNAAGLWGGGLEHHSYSEGLSVSNCVLWGNTDSTGSGEDAQIWSPAFDSNVNYCCIQGWTGDIGGTGNIGDDPLYRDPDGLDNVVGTGDDDPRLRAGSPCVDAADNTAVPADEQDLDNDGNTLEPTPFDLDGNPRFLDDPFATDSGNGTPPIVDMGAYEYEADCNGNGVADDEDISSGTSQDCNENGVPDECDIADGTSGDYDLNGVPDECEDCNGNGVPDACDLDCATGDCVRHPLGCGESEDCDGNGVPDECEWADCNNNGVLDACDILYGPSEDCNANGVPDECELCCGVELVFVLDTSGSMDPEITDVCAMIEQVFTDLQQAGVDTTASVLGITHNPPPVCDLQGLRFSQTNVRELLGPEVPGTPGECGPELTDLDYESWGPATAIVCDRFPWITGVARFVVPIGDEGPCKGDPCVDPGWDRDSISNAINMALLNEVRAYAITGEGSPTCAIGLADDLADATGGEAYHREGPDGPGGDAGPTYPEIGDLLAAAVQAIADNCNDCNNNGIPDDCE